jgi:hypothetical protein
VSAPRRIRSRLGVLGLAIAYLLILFGGTWHLSRENHARCAQHGEWIDVATSPAAAQADAHPGPIAKPAASAQEHEHCVLVEASRLRVVVCEGTPTDLVHDAPAAVAPTRADAPFVAGLVRYLLAPKHSPPC